MIVVDMLLWKRWEGRRVQEGGDGEMSRPSFGTFIITSGAHDELLIGLNMTNG
jgi:hypothetical protein